MKQEAYRILRQLMQQRNITATELSKALSLGRGAEAMQTAIRKQTLRLEDFEALNNFFGVKILGTAKDFYVSESKINFSIALDERQKQKIIEQITEEPT